MGLWRSAGRGPPADDAQAADVKVRCDGARLSEHSGVLPDAADGLGGRQTARGARRSPLRRAHRPLPPRCTTPRAPRPPPPQALPAAGAGGAAAAWKAELAIDGVDEAGVEQGLRRAALERSAERKILAHILPPLFLFSVINYLDRWGWIQRATCIT